MSDDLVDRLRHAQANNIAARALQLPLGDAADEIDRLRAGINALASTWPDIDWSWVPSIYDHLPITMDQAQDLHHLLGDDDV